MKMDERKTNQDAHDQENIQRQPLKTKDVGKVEAKSLYIWVCRFTFIFNLPLAN